MSCTFVDRDQMFVVQDYGPGGFVGVLTIKLTYGLKPGAVLSVVLKTNHEAILHVADAASNFLLTIAGRAYKDDFLMNSFMDKTWGVEERPTKNPMKTGTRTAITILYEPEGYRIVVNGQYVAFYKHRSKNTPHQLEIHGSQIFKTVYLTTVDIIL